MTARNTSKSGSSSITSVHCNNTPRSCGLLSCRGRRTFAVGCTGFSSAGGAVADAVGCTAAGQVAAVAVESFATFGRFTAGEGPVTAVEMSGRGRKPPLQPYSSTRRLHGAGDLRLVPVSPSILTPRSQDLARPGSGLSARAERRPSSNPLSNRTHAVGSPRMRANDATAA